MRKVLLLLALLLASGSALAMAPPRDDGFRWALIIEADRDPELQSVASALADSYGYTQNRLVHVRGVTAGRRQVESALERLYESIRPNDTLLVILSAQVREQANGLFLTSADERVEAPWGWVSLDYIARWLGASRASRTLVVYSPCVPGKGGGKLGDPLALRLQAEKINGTIDILSVCSPFAADSPPKPIGALLATGLGRNAESRALRLSSAMVAETLRKLAPEVQVELVRVPEYVSEGFNLVRTARHQSDYRDQYLQARSLKERQAVLSAMLTAARSEPALESQAVRVFASVAMDRNADAGSDLAAGDALVLRTQANEALATLSTPLAVEALAQVAVDAADDAAVRRDAVSRLSNLPPLYAARAAPAMRAALRDRNPSVRQAAIRGAIIVNDVQVRTALVAIARSDSETIDVRAAAIQALGAIAPTENRQWLWALTNDRNATIRREAILALSATGPSPESTTLLIRRLNEDPDDAAKAAAALAVSRTAGPLQTSVVRNALLGVMQRGPDEVRKGAAFSLGQIGGRAAMDALMRSAIDGSAKTDVRIAAIEAIGEAATTVSEAERNTVAKALAPLSQVADAGVRRATVSALVKFGTQPAAEVALARLNDADPFVRSAARDAAMSSAPGELVKKLRDPSPAVQVQAIRLLGEKPVPEAIEPLFEKVRDPHTASPVRAAAVDVLSRYDDSRVTPTAEALLESPDANARAAAATLLGNRCDRGGDLALLQQYGARRLPVIVRALGQCTSAAAIAAVLQAAEDKNAITRVAAIDAMGMQPEKPAFAGKLKRMSLDDESAEVRVSAIEALGPRSSTSPWAVVEDPPISVTIVNPTPGRPGSEKASFGARPGYVIHDYRWVTTSASRPFKEVKFTLAEDKTKLTVEAYFDALRTDPGQTLSSVSGRLVLFLAPRESRGAP